MAILEVKRLKISFRTNNGLVRAVRDISFKLEKGKTLAIVGESGSGKSVTSKAILGISAGNVLIESGEIIYDGKDLLRASEQDMYHVRGDKIAMIFQDPLSSLNPIVRIGKQITEAMILKNREIRKSSKKELKAMLGHLRTAMNEAKNHNPEDKIVIDNIIADFNGASIKASELESNFNKSITSAKDILSSIKDLLIKLEHRYIGDATSQVKMMLRKLKNISDAYFVTTVKDELNSINETLLQIRNDYKGWKPLSAETKKEKVVSIIANFKKVEALLEAITGRDEIDFFNLGFYINKNPKADLSALSFKEINVQTAKFIDEIFIPIFTEYNRAALEHSVYKTLAFKMKANEMLAEMKKYLEETEHLSKPHFMDMIKHIKPVIDASIDPLKIQKDSSAYVLVNSLTSDLNKYFRSIKGNKKEEARFAKQTARFEKLKGRGKTMEYEVAPKKLISLDDIKRDMISSCQAVIDKYNSTIRKFENRDYKKWEKIAYLLTDYLKEKAKDSVVRLSHTEAKEKAIKLMEEVAIPNARERFKQYPFEFSGGMRQRIVIAIALSAEPEILICDEPTTALDVTIQSQILELINNLKRKRNLSIIFITHDLGVVANMADEVAVMYAGKIVEYGSTEDIFYAPAHPYTWALLSSMPELDTKEKLETIPGTPPNMIYPPKGDAFAARNKYALKIDFEEEPPMFQISDTHFAATWLLDPRAPKVDMPKAIQQRINRMKAAKYDKKGPIDNEKSK